jgi:hypothetical protein
MAKRLYTIDLASRRVVVIPLGSVFPFWCPALFPRYFCVILRVHWRLCLWYSLWRMVADGRDSAASRW